MAPSTERAPLWPHIACCVDESEASPAALREAARLRAGARGGSASCTSPSARRTTGPPPPAWLTDAAAEAGGDPVLLVNLGTAASAACEWAERRAST